MNGGLVEGGLVNILLRKDLLEVDAQCCAGPHYMDLLKVQKALPGFARRIRCRSSLEHVLRVGQLGLVTMDLHLQDSVRRIR